MGFYVIPRRVAWFDTVPGRVDALATMSLMQMIADGYEGAHDKREHHDESSGSSSNEAQEGVRAWLAYAHFLPQLPREQLSPLFSMQMKTSSSAVSSPPKNPNRRWHISLGWLRLPRKHTHSGSTNSFSPLWSLLSLSPLKSWRRRRDSTSSSPTVSEPSTLPTSPSNFSSRSSPVRSHTTPSYKRRLRFSTKISYRQAGTLDDVQVSPSLQSPTHPASPNALHLDFYPPNDVLTCRPERALSFDSTTSIRSLSPSLNSSASVSPLMPAQKSILGKDLSKDRPPVVTLWNLFIITMLGYLLLFFVFLGCFLMAVCKIFGSYWSTTDE